MYSNEGSHITVNIDGNIPALTQRLLQSGLLDYPSARLRSGNLVALIVVPAIYKFGLTSASTPNERSAACANMRTANKGTAAGRILAVSAVLKWAYTCKYLR